jgi:lycopene beta-cyclase
VNTHWDIVIAGGGLAGLAMAVELSRPAFAHLRVLLVEQRSHYVRDRTWSFWAPPTHAHAHLERAAWRQWRVAHGPAQALCSGGMAFRSIDADAYYTEALQRIRASAHVRLQLGTRVAAIGTGWPCSVQLDGGRSLQAGLVIDARPCTQGATLAQHFLGWEIETDSDIFEPGTLDLMDFQAADDGLHFHYVLPYGTRSALVETTWISAPQLHQDHAAQLERYITRRWGALRYRRVYEEQGSLALDPVAPATAGGPVLRVGRAAGTLRPSTGFAFLETLAHCARLAQQLRRCSFPLQGAADLRALRPFHRAVADRWMDALFQRLLAGHWRGAPALFVALFRHTPPERLLRFLSGQAGWRDRLAVMASLPPMATLQALLRLCRPAARPAAGLRGRT